MEISKELLSEVLGYEALPTQVSTKELQYIDKRRKHGAFHPCYINIHELAHKCKEWALSKEYKLLSMSKECFLYDTKELYDVSEQLNQWSEWFDAETEVEAIFKACQWIYEQQKEK